MEVGTRYNAPRRTVPGRAVPSRAAPGHASEQQVCGSEGREVERDQGQAGEPGGEKEITSSRDSGAR